MIKRELMKDPELYVNSLYLLQGLQQRLTCCFSANENWERFLPHFKKRTLSKRKKPFKITDKSKKPYTPFPPPQEKSKVDLQIESGEYFLGMQAKERAAREKREDRQRDRQAQKKMARQKEFIPPTEKSTIPTKKEIKRRHKGEDGSEVRKKKKKKQAVGEDL